MTPPLAACPFAGQRSHWPSRREVQPWRQRGAASATATYQPHPAVRDNLEAFARAALGKAPYPVTHEEMLANVKTFEAIKRSAANGQIETI